MFEFFDTPDSCMGVMPDGTLKLFPTEEEYREAYEEAACSSD